MRGRQNWLKVLRSCLLAGLGVSRVKLPGSSTTVMEAIPLLERHLKTKAHAVDTKFCTISGDELLNVVSLCSGTMFSLPHTF